MEGQVQETPYPNARIIAQGFKKGDCIEYAGHWAPYQGMRGELKEKALEAGTVQVDGKELLWVWTSCRKCPTA